MATNKRTIDVEAFANGPLEGVRILDLARVVAGPYVSRILCEMRNPLPRLRFSLHPPYAALLVILFLSACATPQPPEWRAVPQPDAWAGDAESAFFLQLADTQFGMWSTPKLALWLGMSGNPNSFERETLNMEAAVAHANRLQPAFVVLCGDLVNVPGHAGQVAEFKRIAAKLDPEIPLYLVAGNHDVENAPTPSSLADFRAAFGRDWYSFRRAGIHGIVLNSQLIHSPEYVMPEADAQLSWLREELDRARSGGARQILVFQHHPFFLEEAEEKDQYFNIPEARRAAYLELFRQAGVRAVFAGHYHRNAHGWAGALEMITTGPVGMPLGDDPSGFRIVRVGPHGLDHVYFGLESIPEQLGPR